MISTLTVAACVDKVRYVDEDGAQCVHADRVHYADSNVGVEYYVQADALSEEDVLHAWELMELCHVLYATIPEGQRTITKHLTLRRSGLPEKMEFPEQKECYCFAVCLAPWVYFQQLVVHCLQVFPVMAELEC